MRSIVHYHRKARSTGNFSLEAIFQDVRSRIPNWPIKKVIAPCLSNGIVRRVWILAHAWWSQGLITHVTGDINFATIFLARNRTVLTLLDCFGADKPGLAGYVFRKLWIEWPVAKASLVTTISDASKGDIVKYSGCSPEKVRVIGVAISQQFKRRDKPFNSDSPLLLQVGTSPNKNIERLAQAISGLRCRLLIIGKLSDSQREALDKHNIQFENRVGLSQESLIQAYADCDIVSFVSTFEGFGMPIIEGNAVGRPVITANCTSMPEVAADAAVLVDPYDPEAIRAGIVEIIENGELRDRLVESGFVNATRFHPDRIAEQYAQVYRELLGDNLPEELR